MRHRLDSEDNFAGDVPWILLEDALGAVLPPCRAEPREQTTMGCSGVRGRARAQLSDSSAVELSALRCGSVTACVRACARLPCDTATVIMSSYLTSSSAALTFCLGTCQRDALTALPPASPPCIFRTAIDRWRVHTHTHTRTRTHAHPHTHTQTHTHARTHAHPPFTHHRLTPASARGACGTDTAHLQGGQGKTTQRTCGYNMHHDTAIPLAQQRLHKARKSGRAAQLCSAQCTATLPPHHTRTAPQHTTLRCAAALQPALSERSA
jgi:hypothetical protein